MSRTALNTRDTPRPKVVTVARNNCGGQFTTDETTAYAADQNDEVLLFKPCQNDQPARPLKPLEQPEIDAIREDMLYRDAVGQDAEPPVEASVPESVAFGDLARLSFVEVELNKGTELLGPITVSVEDVRDGGLRLTVSLKLSTSIYTREIQTASFELDCTTNRVVSV